MISPHFKFTYKIDLRLRELLVWVLGCFLVDGKVAIENAVGVLGDLFAIGKHYMEATKERNKIKGLFFGRLDLHLQVFFYHGFLLVPHDIVKEERQKGHCRAAQLVSGILFAAIEGFVSYDLEQSVLQLDKEEVFRQ